MHDCYFKHHLVLCTVHVDEIYITVSCYTIFMKHLLRIHTLYSKLIVLDRWSMIIPLSIYSWTQTVKQVVTRIRKFLCLIRVKFAPNLYRDRYTHCTMTSLVVLQKQQKTENHTICSKKYT